MTSSAELFATGPDAAVTPHAGDRHVAILGGEQVELFAHRALFWPAGSTLFVADVHLGKAAAFRAGGVPLPRGGTRADLARLTALLQRTRAQRLVVLGDFLHAAAGRVAALDAAFKGWRATHAGVTLTLVRGNHDDRAGDPPADWDIEVVTEPHPLAPFLACHVPVTPTTGYALCGHVHPGVFLRGSADDSARLPCFVLGRRRAILPAFGGFTGLALVAPARGDRLVAIAGTRLFALPG
ncbi:MAG: ligase-associated DNA damage response endonuclease PdeM [Casimicrobiaceae bacterium]